MKWMEGTEVKLSRMGNWVLKWKRILTHLYDSLLTHLYERCQMNVQSIKCIQEKNAIVCYCVMEDYVHINRLHFRLWTFGESAQLVVFSASFLFYLRPGFFFSLAWLSRIVDMRLANFLYVVVGSVPKRCFAWNNNYSTLLFFNMLSV